MRKVSSAFHRHLRGVFEHHLHRRILRCNERNVMNDDSYMEQSQLGGRIATGVLLLLLAAFALSSMSVFTATAESSDLNGKRDDDVREVSYKDDDDDDDDSGGNSGASRSGSRSIGSRSANTRTGSTRGTGVSRSVSNSGGQSFNTRTGTTRGTGASRSVSNSS